MIYQVESLHYICSSLYLLLGLALVSIPDLARGADQQEGWPGAELGHGRGAGAAVRPQRPRNSRIRGGN